MLGNIKLILLLMIFVFTECCCKNENVFIKTGVPDIEMEIKKISFEMFNGDKIEVSLNEKNHTQLKEINIFLEGNKLNIINDELHSVCSLNLYGIKIHNITRTRNKKSYFSDDFTIEIPFNDYYKDCIFPKNYDDLPINEYELEIRVINKEINNIKVVKYK